MVNYIYHLPVMTHCEFSVPYFVCVCERERDHVDLGLKTEVEAFLEQLSYFMEL